MIELQTDHLIQLAKTVQPWIVDIRRTLHQMPELRWQEEKTLAYIRQQIETIAATVTMPTITLHEARGGLWVDVTFDEIFDRILLRSDVDALPIQEQTDLPYASQNFGLMHACGHDTHPAMLLGAFKILVEQADLYPTHNLRFVFQRAEENPITQSGGATLVQEGVLEDISQAYTLHIWSSAESGLFRSRPGPIMANSDRLKIEITCKGGHVASPHSGSNAIDIAVDIQVALRGFDTRFLGPSEPVSFVPAVFKAGSASNIRPAAAELWFAVRNVLPPEQRAAFHEAIRQAVTHVVARYADATGTVTPVYGHPALINSAEAYQNTRKRLTQAGQKTDNSELNMGGEDFAHYLEAQGGVPGCIWFLGAWQDGTGDHHTPTFNPNEAVFWQGTLFWLLLACG